MRSVRNVSSALLLAGTAAIASGSAVAQPSVHRGAQAAPATRAAPAPSYDRFVLPNGLTTLVHTDHTSPSVFVGIWYKTGSRDEPVGKTGFAHLFEHLMFQSTAHRKQEFMAALKLIGAVNANGVTRTDNTAYFETVPTNALDSVLWLESDRMGYLDGGITQALLDEQRRVVLNEKRQGELRPEELAWRHFLTAFYPVGHPYAHPTIGSTEDIEAASLADVKQWFQDHYGAGNAVLVLSGDIDAATAREKVTRYFSAIRPGTPINRPLQWTPSQTEARRDILYGGFATANVSRSWPIPNDDPRERTLLLLAARAMAGPKDSPLVQALVTDAKVATAVTATVSESELQSTLSVSMGVRPGVSPDTASKALDQALRDYASKGPKPERLQSIVAATDASLLRSLENTATIGNWFGEGEVAHGDPTYFLRQREWITSVTPGEVRAVAAKWLERPFYELTTLPLPNRTAAASDVDRSQMPAPGSFKSAIDFPPLTEMVLSNGLKVVVAQRAAVGMVDLHLQFAGGALSGSYPPGTAARALELLSSGAKAGNGEPIERRLSQLGMGLGGSAGPWNTGLVWSVPNDRLAESFAVAANLVQHPIFPEPAVAEANTNAARRFDSYERDPTNAGVNLLKRAIWGDGDPRGHIATRAEPEAISRETLLRFQAQQLVPNAGTLYIVGDVSPARAKTLAEQYFGGWKAAPPAPSHPLPIALPVGAKLILVDAPGAQQSSITVGSLAPAFDKDASATEALVTAIIADIGSGRLNNNLRQDKGWSYGFGGGIEDSPVGQRLFIASGTVQADRTGASVAELQREFSDVAGNRPLTEQELDGQRTAMTRAQSQHFTRNDAFLNALVTSGAYGLSLDRAASTDRRLAAVTLDRAQRLARTLFQPDALTWIVIGDLKTIEPQLRAPGLPPVEVWDLYGHKLR